MELRQPSAVLMHIKINRGGVGRGEGGRGGVGLHLTAAAAAAALIMQTASVRTQQRSALAGREQHGLLGQRSGRVRWRPPRQVISSEERRPADRVSQMRPFSVKISFQRKAHRAGIQQQDGGQAAAAEVR